MAKISQPRTPRILQRYIDILRHQLPILRRKYHVSYLGVFGSYVQGNPGKTSDLDLLIDFTEAPSLFEFIQLESYLSALLGVKVDLVLKSTLKPLIGQHILNEVVNL
ncbi:MAG: nucleotidyltransferase family protein [Nitrospirales bacterium]|nr:nucleotidyltransferase family protein [Nitrospirales bacterium]